MDLQVKLSVTHFFSYPKEALSSLSVKFKSFSRNVLKATVTSLKVFHCKTFFQC
jgi:hypothetical protein